MSNFSRFSKLQTRIEMIEDLLRDTSETSGVKKKTRASKFKEGDRVSFYGRKGTVENIDDDLLFPIKISFDQEYVDWFTADGKWLTNDDKPSLKKLKRKTKGKK